MLLTYVFARAQVEEHKKFYWEKSYAAASDSYLFCRIAWRIWSWNYWKISPSSPFMPPFSQGRWGMVPKFSRHSSLGRSIASWVFRFAMREVRQNHYHSLKPLTICSRLFRPVPSISESWWWVLACWLACAWNSCQHIWTWDHAQ